MGKLIVFLILGFMAYAVLKQLMSVLRFFEPKQPQQQQKGSPVPETVDMTTPEVVSANAEGGQDWAEEIKRSYDLFKAGALTNEEFEQLKAQLLARVGAKA